MRKLLVITNESIDTWADEMTREWDKIKVIPSIRVPYGASEVWIENEATDFIMKYIGADSENSNFSFVYLNPENMSMLFYNEILHWRFRYTTFMDPLFVPIIDVDSLKPTGEFKFVRWLTLKTN